MGPAAVPARLLAGGRWPARRRLLCRNYDYSPDLFEQVVYSSAFTGRRVIGTGDCLWGLLDGMNDDGLVVSLTFGGRPGSAPGFAIPLVVRYLLEVAGTTRRGACSCWRGVPVAMAYNLTMIDAHGEVRTAFVAPGGRAGVLLGRPRRPTTAGRTPEYPDHARRFRSVERSGSWSGCSAGPGQPDDLVDALPARHPCTAPSTPGGSARSTPPPTGRPRGAVDYRWPGQSWTRTFDSPDATTQVMLRQS